MRLVLDTNDAVSAVLGSSAPTRLIELAAEGAFDLKRLRNLKSFHRMPMLSPADALAAIVPRA